MTCLSMPAALASTPDPTYRTSASSSRPCSVPSSPNGPCSSGNTTSTSPRACGTCSGLEHGERPVAGLERHDDGRAGVVADLGQPAVGELPALGLGRRQHPATGRA